jgi:ATP-dependent DNA ligase
MDGMRCELVVREERGAIFFSRNGRELDLLGSMDESVARLIYHLGPNFVMDGELVVVRDGKILDRKTGNGILNKASKGTISKEEADMVHMVVWDLITYEGFDKGLDKTPYKVRLTSLQHAIDGIKRFALVNTKVVDTFEETQAFYSEQRMQGQEGIILKSADGPWEDKRSKHLIKFKAEEECDLVITGWEEGTGKYKGMCGALIGETRDGKVVVGVGSGFTAAERASIGEEVIGKIMAVKYNAVIQDKRQPDLYSLFLPIFVEVRTDKTVADKFEDLK